MDDYHALLAAAVRDTSLLENLFDRLPDVLFYVKDRQARYIFANLAVVEQSGARTKQDVYGRTADELFPVSGYSTLAQDMEVINSGKPIEDLLRVYFSADGGKQWCLSSKYPIQGEDGTVQGLIGVSRGLPKPNEKHHNYKRLNAFLKILNENQGERILISEAARKVNLSADVLEKISKEIFQLTPKQLLLQIRINRACSMLESTDLSITEIAAECGYSDHSAFSRQFKIATHFSPRDFRNAEYHSVTGTV